MERDFRYLRDIHGDAGARDVFEKICTRLLQAQFSGEAHNIVARPGDGGIDILVGDFSKPIAVYQCKYFLDGIGDSQKEQIRESYKKVMSSTEFTVSEWYLCLPCELSLPEFAWWSAWRKQKMDTGDVAITLNEGSLLIGQLKKYDLYNTEFDEDVRLALDEILETLSESKRRIFEEIIALPGKEELSNFDGMLFVKKLESAKIRHIDGCKNDYFNAELAEHSIASKGLDDEVRVYNNLKAKVYSFWENQYRFYQHDDDGNELLMHTYERIENADTQALASINAINLMAKKGMLHQLAEECSVGWLKDYKEKLEKYLQESGESVND